VFILGNRKGYLVEESPGTISHADELVSLGIVASTGDKLFAVVDNVHLVLAHNPKGIFQP
jgi:hypothetical protein